MSTTTSDFGCCSAAPAACAGCAGGSLTRRGFLASGSALAAVASAGAREPARQQPIRIPLRVQPVLVYRIKARKPATSWRTTAEIHTEAAGAEENERINRDLKQMASAADFPLEILPLEVVRDTEKAAAVAAGKHDVLVMYAAGHTRDLLDALALPDRWNVIFVRHKSGPIYYMYIGVHPHFLRKTRDEFGHPGMDTDDVVVDSHADLLWRLRSFYALKNTLGKRVVAIGAAGGWGADGRGAPDRARARWKFDLVTVPYPDLEVRLKKAYADAGLVKRCDQLATRYLAQKGVRLETSRDFVSKAFVLTEVFRDILDEAQTDALTIGACMSTIMPISETTACLPLSLLNDEGYLAFCESDFVVIPAGILLHYLSGKPVFLCNASFPYNGIVTVSHCTAPRRMDGREAEPARILTHYESDYGAAPKVDMRKGQTVTILNPDFAGRRCLGFAGEIQANPFFPICRTQLEVGVKTDTARIVPELRGFHWMLCYGNHLQDTGYALKRAGVGWLALT